VARTFLLTINLFFIRLFCPSYESGYRLFYKFVSFQ
jgi:hypothetical protein